MKAKGTILIVEYGKSRYMAELVNEGYSVECVAGGAEAIKKIMENTHLYQAIIITPRIKDVSPCELVRVLATTNKRTIHAKIPAVLLEKHATGISQGWFVIAPDTVEAAKQALKIASSPRPQARFDKMHRAVSSKTT